MNKHYFETITDTIAQIQHWLNGSHSSATELHALQSRFTPDFSMTTTQGVRLDYAGLATFFQAAAGSKPGLVLEVRDLTLLQESQTGAVVSFCEVQTLPNGSSDRRYSTALLQSGKNKQLHWRYLQETSCLE
jgi:hypothetical protein